MKILKTILLMILILIISALAVYKTNDYINNKVFVKEYSFPHEEIPAGFNGYKIMMISDLHNAPFSGQINEHIKKHEPDIIVFTGDMVQLPHHSLDETLKIAEAAGNIPVYAISGNHETQCGEYKKIIKTLRESNVIILDNDSVCLEENGDTMLLLGMRDPEHNEIGEGQFEDIRERIESEFPDGPCFSILLSHRADIYPEIKHTSADLILSGHLHGGIIRVPFIGGIINKNGELSTSVDYEYGLFEESGAASMLVSGGCDKNPEKKRVLNPPEIVLLTLQTQQP